ncbi:MAG: radical SAM protein [Candidatus Krumholzibacteriia bacterium]
MAAPVIDHSSLYRLPWTLPDNGISWLEPTSECNLVCDGCYRKNESGNHKSLEEVKRELDVFQRLRRSDCISVAGGDPLVYPDIVPLVREIRERGFKAIVNTNGKALTPGLLHDLKRAGVFGFTFHVDSGQRRGAPWDGKSELELCDLRLKYALMLAREGGIACSFNSTVYAENIEHVPQLLDWAQQHMDIVHTMVFICFRHVVPDMPFEWWAGGRRVPWDEIWYHSDQKRKVTIGSQDLVRRMREVDPAFTPMAYLNGTHQPEALKWLVTERIGNADRIFGYAGPRFAELATGFYHWRTGKYLSYASPATCRHGRLAMALLAPLDPGLERSAGRWLRWVVRRPLRAFRPVHLQSIMFIQPVDFTARGDQSMCDGCPDITVHEGQLVWSCRLEELKAYGSFLRTVPLEQEAVETQGPGTAARAAGRGWAVDG